MAKVTIDQIFALGRVAEAFRAASAERRVLLAPTLVRCFRALSPVVYESIDEELVIELAQVERLIANASLPSAREALESVRDAYVRDLAERILGLLARGDGDSNGEDLDAATRGFPRAPVDIPPGKAA